MDEQIIIHRLKISAQIGITAEERAKPQILEVCATIVPEAGFAEMQDRIETTVDYAKVCESLAHEAASRERELIETLALDLAQLILANFPAREATVEVRKFILPETEHVAVRTRIAKSGLSE